MTLSKHTRRRLLALLDAAANETRVDPGEAHVLRGILSRVWEPRRNEAAVAARKTRLAAKQAKWREEKDEMAEIRAAVMARSGGRCEVCGSRSDVELDHWVGGTGQRREKQSVENCWLLCRKDHGQRQANRPNAAHWNSLFAIHAQRHGYPILQHIEHLQVVTR